MLVEFMLDFVLGVIGTLGYAGVFVLMFLESTMAPVPSELIMPFAGFLAAEGVFDFWLVVVIATLGSMGGSLLSYWIGKVIEQETIMKIGKFLFISKHDFEIANNWFEKHGSVTIFVCRFVPAIRHVISIPAGFAGMQKRKFVTFTLAGAFLWNLTLAYSGVLLKENWVLVSDWFSVIDIVIIVGVLTVIGFFIWKRISKN
ncbi:MAG: DedA family protein [Candidatus Diapherotrites archaeon]